MAFKIFFTTNTPNKLEHIALWQIYGEFINTCLIFTYNSLKKCYCDQFQGCRMKPLASWLNGKRNYCFVCRVRVAYNINKIYKITEITEIINTHLQIKENLQLCINFGYKNVWLYCFQTNLEIKKKKFSKNYPQYLRKFTIDGYYKICVRNLWH